MDINDEDMIVLILSEQDVKELDRHARTDITALNYQAVPISVKCTADLLLSQIRGEKLRLLTISFEEWDLLKGTDKEYYRWFNGKTVGEDLFTEIKSYIRKLREQKRENNVEC